jgi:hypothetical protein
MGWWNRAAVSPAEEQWRQWRERPDGLVLVEIEHMARHWKYNTLIEEATTSVIITVERLTAIAELICTAGREPIVEMTVNAKLENSGLLEIDPRKCVALWAGDLNDQIRRRSQVDLECWIPRGFRDDHSMCSPFWRS